MKLPCAIRVVTLLLLASAGAGAAPVPKDATDKEAAARHWGRPYGTGAFDFGRDRLTLRSKGEPVYNSKLPEQRTMPHTLRSVTGDFELTVRVLEAPALDPKAKIDRAPGSHFATAGLFVIGGDYRLQVDYWQSYSTRNGVVDKDPARRVWIDAMFTTGSIVSLLAPVEDGTPELRITRTGKTVSAAYRFGGGKWSAPHTPRVALEFPETVAVGVSMTHSTYQSLHATFDRFTVEQPSAPPK
ncbi:MAG: DUF1349 domain-containing protein [Planctomycetes bacterium]|nr:DUF1349 domain-containing protein [Planctomycetota bacterium]